MTDRYTRISATLTFDGAGTFPWLQSGMRLKFRLDAMPRGNFLPNMGMRIDGVIQHGGNGQAQIDVIVDENTWPLLTKGATFTLHDSPSETVAHGSVISMLYPVDTPLPPVIDSL
jgi:hypothetical protein